MRHVIQTAFIRNLAIKSLEHAMEVVKTVGVVLYVTQNAKMDIMVETAQIFVARIVTSQVDVTKLQENVLEVVNQGGLETCVIRSVYLDSLDETVKISVAATVETLNLAIL